MVEQRPETSPKAAEESKELFANIPTHSEATQPSGADALINEVSAQDIPKFIKGIFLENNKSKSNILFNLYSHLLYWNWLEKSYFMVDTDAHLAHFFRTSKDHKPSKTLSLMGGVLTSDLQADIVDETTGQHIPSFKFQFMSSNGKKKGKELIVLPE